MIYLHCGWPKTGTTSLQAALSRNQERLAAAGLLYPERWRRDVDGSHNDLTDLLEAHHRDGCDFDELRGFLAANADTDVLFSGESLTVWSFFGGDKYASLLGLVTAMQEVAPVRCIWTLRRGDELIHSFERRAALERGLRVPTLRSWVTRNTDQIGALFQGMRALEDAAAGGGAYVRYDPAAGHVAELLRAFDMPEGLAQMIKEEVDVAPRLNITPTCKQVVASADVDAIAATMGVELAREQLLRIFEREGFRFQGDSPCVLLGPEMSLSLHEQVLESALDIGFSPYTEFFEGEKVADLPPLSPLGPLTDEDVSRLATHIRGPGSPQLGGS